MECKEVKEAGVRGGRESPLMIKKKKLVMMPVGRALPKTLNLLRRMQLRPRRTQIRMP